MASDPNEIAGSGHPYPTPRRPAFWTSKLFLLAALSLLIGTGLWIRDTVSSGAPGTQPNPPASTSPSPLSGSLAADGPAPTTSPTTSGDSQVGADAPLTFRLGAGFMGGFFVAWALKKFIRLALLVGGAIAVTIAVLKGTGVIELNWSGVEQTVKDGFAHAESQAVAMKDTILRYVPGGFSTAVGLFVGARRG
jgi:uncharacterized membrane protein (Fun14 family)